MGDYDTTLPEDSGILRSNTIRLSSILQLTDILTQNILLHPLIALRRTCQVNRKCSPFICIQPFSLVPFLYHQQRKQGTALYKGLSSELLVKGITLGAETAIINYTDWPREVGCKQHFRDLIQMLALKGLSVAISTPFLCAAVKETVQSVIVVRDRPSFVDCIRDGFLRLIHLRSTPSARMLPVWLLVVPTVLYHVSHSLIWQTTIKFLEVLRNNCLLSPKHSNRHINNKMVDNSVIDDSKWQTDDSNQETTQTNMHMDKIDSDGYKISNSIVACLVADVVLLPIEVVLNSLYIQGTRTIIDNVDETTVVLPVLTNYDGFKDCYQSIVRCEGNLGLYKGLGALILQYSVHYLVFRVFYQLLKEFQPSYQIRSVPRPRCPLIPPQREYRQFLEKNRHSTPSNPSEPKSNFDSLLFHDTTIDSRREEAL